MFYPLADWTNETVNNVENVCEALLLMHSLKLIGWYPVEHQDKNLAKSLVGKNIINILFTLTYSYYSSSSGR